VNPSSVVPAKPGTHPSAPNETIGIGVGEPPHTRAATEWWVPAFAGTAELRAEKLAAAGGVRIAGVELSEPLSPELKDTIWRAFLAHHIVVFAGQFLTREQQFAFAANFGEVEVHGAHRGEAKRYDVAHVMSNLDPDGNPVLRVSKAANYHWHTDKPYQATPPMLTMLRAVEVPPPERVGWGGDTDFANTALAYDALPDEMKRRIAGLRVVFRPAFEESRPAVDHPLVRTHPETGRNALYIGNHSTHILGLPEAVGRALLDELVAHATQPQFVYRHRWRAGDLVMWDNRCLLHRLVVDPALSRYRRVMHRSVVRGTVPV
jgi:alpha-ketoglutarate-dependent taurine dioxygenase